MRLINFLNEGINDRGVFKAVFMAGHPGAGKTFALNKIKSGQVEPRWVNTDKLFLDKDRLDKMSANSRFRDFARDWENNWKDIRDDVKRINKNQLVLYLNSILPLAVDGTSNSIDTTMKRKNILTDLGYDTAMVFVNCNIEAAIERAAKRERKVDPEFIKQAYENVNNAKEHYSRATFGDWAEIDNNDGELTEKVILNAFRHMSSFYNRPVSNDVGQHYMDQMDQNGWKYLTPNIRSMDKLKNDVDNWYRN